MTVTDRPVQTAAMTSERPVTTAPRSTMHPVDVDARVVALTRACGPRVLAYLTRRCPDREEAADLFGETLTVLWRRRADLPGDDEQAFAWMIGVARNTLATSARSRARRAALAERLRADHRVSDHLVGAPDQVGGSPSSEAAERVLAALAQLTEADQELLRLDAWDALSGEQIGQVLGISASAARQRLSRARSRLRSVVGRGGGDWT